MNARKTGSVLEIVEIEEALDTLFKDF